MLFAIMNYSGFAFAPNLNIINVGYLDSDNITVKLPCMGIRKVEIATNQFIIFYLIYMSICYSLSSFGGSGNGIQWVTVKFINDNDCQP